MRIKRQAHDAAVRPGFYQAGLLYPPNLGVAQGALLGGAPGGGTRHALLNQLETAASLSSQFQNLGSAGISAHLHGNVAPGVSAPILFTLAPRC